MNADRTIRTERRASLSLEGQWHGPGRVANASKPFTGASDREAARSVWRSIFDRSPDFWGALGTLVVVVILWAFVVRSFL